MHQLTSAEKGWYSLVFLVGVSLWALSMTVSPVDQTIVAFTLITFASLFRHVRLSDHDYHSVYTLDDVPLYALIFLRGWEPAALVAGVSRFCYEIYRLLRARRLHPDRVNVVHVLYHFSDIPMVVIVTATTGWLYEVVNGGEVLLSGARNALAMALAVCVWLPLAFGQNAVCLTLRRERPWREIFTVLRQNLVHIRIHVLMLVPLGALLALFWAKAPLATLLLVVPVTLMHSAIKSQRQLRLESEQTAQALTHYLEERDEYTQGHSERVAEFATVIARQMGLPEGEIEQVRRAGLIHDIGKVDIPDGILNKPGGLTRDEREIMRTHTDRAVDLGRELVALRRELPFREAAYHHENYDGTGHYRLVGEEIPLISRILAVADTFDAITSDRPYRQGLPMEEAVKRIQEVRGSQLDPKVVDAFLEAREPISQVLEKWR